MVLVGGVERHQYLIESKTFQALDQKIGIRVAGDAEETNHLLLFGFLESFDRAALAEDAVHVALVVDVVELPGVEVVGVE